MICEKCGEPIAQDALYCENCGARAALQADAAQNAAQARRLPTLPSRRKI